MTPPGAFDRASRVPRDGYQRPEAARPDALRLDGNEGSSPDPSLLEALLEHGTGVLRDYPSTAALAESLARRFDVTPERIVVTTGADDALDRVCRAFLEPGRSVVLPIPTFEMLRRFADIAGGEAITVPWSGAYPVEEVVAAVRPDTALVAVVSPNNPTGTTIGSAEFGELAERISDAVILLDHAYVEYADNDLTASALSFPNVVVVRTLSKAWGLAGCRVGYALASADLATIIRNAGNPYPVSGLSLAVAAARLADGDDQLAAHVRAIRDQRDRVHARLTDHGIPTPPSEGNFVFPDFGERADFAYGTLQFAGVVTRRFPSRPEIANGLRISLPGDDAGLARLETALDLVLAPEAVLLDLDGVIADVRESYRQCVIRVAESYSVAVSDGDIQAEKRAGNANNDWELTRRLLEGRGLTVSLDDVIERYQALYHGTGDVPGLRKRETLLTTREVLSALKGPRKLAIVTGRPREEAAWFLTRHGIADLIDRSVCLEDGPIKPDPFPVRRACELLQCRRAWMIGDTPDDMRAAADAGVVPIGILAPGDDADAMSAALSRAGAVTVIDGLDTLKGWLA